MDTHFQKTDASDIWATPQAIVDSLGHFDLDACALPSNAKCEHFYTPDDNSLIKNWGGANLVQPALQPAAPISVLRKNGGTWQWYPSHLCPHWEQGMAGNHLSKGRCRAIPSQANQVSPSRWYAWRKRWLRLRTCCFWERECRSSMEMRH